MFAFQMWRLGCLLFLFVASVVGNPLIRSQTSNVSVNKICLASQQVIQVIIREQVIRFPIRINTFIARNTVLVINGGVTININNAPTQLNINTVGISTRSVTSTTSLALPSGLSAGSTGAASALNAAFVDQGTSLAEDFAPAENLAFAAAAARFVASAAGQNAASLAAAGFESAIVASASSSAAAASSAASALSASAAVAASSSASAPAASAAVAGASSSATLSTTSAPSGISTLPSASISASASVSASATASGSITNLPSTALASTSTGPPLTSDFFLAISIAAGGGGGGAPTQTAGAAVRRHIVEAGRISRRQQADAQLVKDSQNANSTTDNCGEAQTFQIRQGQLFRDGTLVSVNPGVGSAIFSELGSTGSITTGFTVFGNSLQWVNDAFPNRIAYFCQVPSGDVYAIFADPSVTGCANVTLSYFFRKLPHRLFRPHTD
ncbi:MAG: hypothetical protein M1817_000352 [Caeruleum heppii]|nr:MAG: hypothetical protein M1817_000352 [Caeruleum heppii]